MPLSRLVQSEKVSKKSSVPLVRVIRPWRTLAGILLVVIAAGIIVWPFGFYENLSLLKNANKFPPRLGLDLSGGASLIYQAHLDAIPESEHSAAMSGVRDVIERRVNSFGIAEATVQVAGSNRLIVDLPSVTDISEAVQKIGETPILDFRIPNPAAQQEPVLSSDQQKELSELNARGERLARDIISRLRGSNADFAELAREFSDDPGSRDVGGDLGWVRRGQFVPEFDVAIFDSLKVGQITPDPIVTQFGRHIIQKLEERIVKEQDPQDASKQIEVKEVKSRHILIRTKTPSDIVPRPDPWIMTSLSGKNLRRAQVVFNQLGLPEIQITFDDEGTRIFSEITKNNIGKPIGIFLDGQSISEPVVQAEITTGTAVITGDFRLADAKQLAQRLNAGALPVPISLVSQQTIGPSLGEESVRKSITAGIVGLILVAVFMILVYRLPGLLSVIALLIYATITFALYLIFGVTLTLAGVAGFILSVGMAVDANILVFARLREELDAGRSLRDAMEEAFGRAWTSIRDSNISSILTCLILIWFGTSIIQGFAITLLLGILVSMFTAISVTRTLLRLAERSPARTHLWLFGASRSSN